MTAPLRRVLVRPPGAGALSRWAEHGWRSAPDRDRIVAEHAALRAALAEAGVDVLVGEPDRDDPDAVYVYDPALVTDRGAVLLRPGKEARRGEVDAVARDLGRSGVEVLGRLEPPACAEGGDLLWLDEQALAVGLGYRTNAAGAEQLARLLPHVEVLAFDLPHFRGPTEVLHLLSLVSPLDRDLALAHVPLLPVRLVQLLRGRGVRLLELPEEELDSLGCNVLALAPRVVLALEGNPATRRRLEAAGAEVRTYPGEELSRKGDGGPTCLTLPLTRGRG